MRFAILQLICAVGLAAAGAVSAAATDFASTWHKQNDRIWLGPQYWANPMEDWRIANGRIECTHQAGNRTVHVLTRQLSSEEGDFKMSVRLGRIDDRRARGAAGFRIGIRSELADYRSALLASTGMNIGVTSEGQLFVGRSKAANPTIPVLTKKGVELRLSATKGKKANYRLVLSAHALGDGAKLAELVGWIADEDLVGNIALLHNWPGAGGKKKGQAQGPGPRFWFSHWTMSGSKLTKADDHAFGPVLYTQYTLSRGVMKMMVQMPPIGAKDQQKVHLELRRQDGWKVVRSSPIHEAARTALFRVEDWDGTKAVPYRVRYRFENENYFFNGTIRAEPTGRPLTVAGFTGNKDTAFPNALIARNVAIQNPDVLFFSGDQIYEDVGGFGIYRMPVDKAILNYLRKIYLWGWAFRDLMRDRPTITLPDDHDVYQGNIWGNGGNAVAMKNHAAGGYAMHEDFVNAVHLTQVSHHPDAYDPTPIARGISVYYGDMVYGRVSFAVIADRMFKAGPQGTVSTWPGRPDHIKGRDVDTTKLDQPELPLLGDRQLAFLEHWAGDWAGADMKVVLSQTIFVNLANYHGPGRMFLTADLDSNGWPQSGRNRALRAMRKGFAVHYAGDQHLASITHYGVDAFEDSGFAFCVPSIAAGYPRSWRPDDEERPAKNRKTGPNTGDYLDGLGNHITVWAVGNPAEKNRAGRINMLHDKASGHGILRLDTAKRKITMECWRLQFDAKQPRKSDQFPGWPLTVKMEQNYGRAAHGHLAEVHVIGADNPLFKVIDEANGELVYAIRPGSTSFRPKVFADSTYTVEAGDPDTGRMAKVSGLKTVVSGRVEVTVE